MQWDLWKYKICFFVFKCLDQVLDFGIDLKVEDCKFVVDFVDLMYFDWLIKEDEEGCCYLIFVFFLKFVGDEDDEEEEGNLVVYCVIKIYDNVMVVDIFVVDVQDQYKKLYQDKY